MPEPTGKTREVTVYGSSDDLVEVDGAFYEEYCVLDKPCSLVFAGILRVTVVYDNNGEWRISCGPINKEVTVPEVSIGQHENGYSQVATFTIPEELPLTVVREHVEEN